MLDHGEIVEWVECPHKFKGGSVTTWNVRSNVDPSGWSNRNPAGQSVILGGV